jgi:hypothetical protein
MSKIQIRLQRYDLFSNPANYFSANVTLGLFSMWQLADS